jgi:hypothetical protein
VTAARVRGEQYLLERGLSRRRSIGEAIVRDRKSGADWSRFTFPTRWHYDVLRGLDCLREASLAPDERAAEAVALVAAQRGGDGRWTLNVQHEGAMPVELGERVGEPSRWITLRALRWFGGPR